MPQTIPLQLFNSLTRQTETFTPVREGEARVYTCGPTVYNYPHIGNMRAYVFADVLGRTLTYAGFKLSHVINITDVGHLTDDADAGEDKLEKQASREAKSIWAIAAHYTEAYWADIRALNIRGPMAKGQPDSSNWSIATKYIEQMIEFAGKISDKHCYEIDSGLYFDVSTVADYGRLARAATEDDGNDVGGRIEAVDGKRHPADFAIWRKTPPGEKRQMEWDSPWGRGAPGWHLECSVMSEALLDFPFDIHTGGIDHREIHHPNEIAQNQAFCCAGGLDVPGNSGANLWMHNNFLVERSGKMSKSSGEFLRLQLLIDKGYHPLAYRMMCLQAHYRSELEFSWEGLGAALTRLKRLVMAVERARAKGPIELTPASRHVLEHMLGGDNKRSFKASIADDLNTPKALADFEYFIFQFGAGEAVILEAIEEIDSVLGLNLLTFTRADLRIRPKSATITEAEVETILAMRKQARIDKDFARSDALRDQLTAQGIEVMDGDPLGWEWRLDA